MSTATDRKHFSMIIDGKSAEAQSGQTFETFNPANNEVLATVARAGRADVDAAVAAARGALNNAWKKTSAAKRTRLLMKYAELIQKNIDELARLETMNCGKPVWASKAELTQGIEDFEFYAGAITKMTGETLVMPNNMFAYTTREPVGVCGQIIPWNYPAMMAAWKIAPALAAGCTVVLKPASATPLTALRLGELALEAGIPAGVVNVITGPGAEIGSYMAEHPGIDKIAFTGETETGKAIMRAAAGTMKRVTLELGGKSPNLVFEDADLTAAVNGSVFAVFYSSGQSCEARTRVYVHEKVYDAFLADFVAKTQKLVVGDPLHEKTQLGALISRSHLQKVHGYVESGVAEGARLECGGVRLETGDLGKGNFYAPAVLTGTNQTMKCVREEIFGPVVTISSFKTEAEALELANDTEYGLAGTIWSGSGARTIRTAAAIKAGLITVNQPFTGFPGVPFGGFKQSGFGRELALDTLKLYTEQKAVVQWVGEKPLNPFGL